MPVGNGAHRSSKSSYSTVTESSPPFTSSRPTARQSPVSSSSVAKRMFFPSSNAALSSGATSCAASQYVRSIVMPSL